MESVCVCVHEREVLFNDLLKFTIDEYIFQNFCLIQGNMSTEVSDYSKIASPPLVKWFTSSFLPITPAQLRSGINSSQESKVYTALSVSLSPCKCLSLDIYSPMRSLEEEELEATIWTRLLLSSVHYLNKDPVDTTSRLSLCYGLSTNAGCMTVTQRPYRTK